MREIVNSKPLHYDDKMCISFKAERSDLSGGVKVETNWPVTQKQLVSACAEFGGYHAMHIWPDLNGFYGYDCIQYDLSGVEIESE